MLSPSARSFPTLKKPDVFSCLLSIISRYCFPPEPKTASRSLLLISKMCDTDSDGETLMFPTLACLNRSWKNSSAEVNAPGVLEKETGRCLEHALFVSLSPCGAFVVRLRALLLDGRGFPFFLECSKNFARIFSVPAFSIPRSVTGSFSSLLLKSASKFWPRLSRFWSPVLSHG